MKNLEKLTDDRRVRLATQRAREALMRQAAESWSFGGEELAAFYRKAEPIRLDTREKRRRTWLRTAAVVVLVATALGLMVSFGMGRVQPVPDGYAMNLSADRANAIGSINYLIYNL